MVKNMDAVEELLHQLGSNDPILRENAAYVLGEMASEAQKMASNTLKSNPQLSAINILCDENVKQRVAEAVRFALTDADPWVRGNAADALGKLGDKQAIESLSKLIHDQENIVRYSAAVALGMIDTEASAVHLVAALKDRDWSVRLSAAKAFEKQPTKNAIAALKNATNDKNPDVREKCLAALAQLS